MNTPIRSAVTWLALLLLLSSLFAPSAFAQGADRKGSPFEGLRWDGDLPEVMVQGEWYRPILVHGLAVSDVLAFCEDRWPGKMRKRFGEDLVEAMSLMGHQVPGHVDLRLATIPGGDEVERKGVAITRANREAIRRGGHGSSFLTREQALADLAEFSARLKDQFAYLHLGDFDWESELDALREDLPDRVATGDLARRVLFFMAHFRDGHASVSSDHLPKSSSFPPFLLQEAEGGVVAFLPDRTGFLDDEHPYVLAIDGISIDAWIDSASRFVVDGSPQLVRRRALRGMRDLELLRATVEGTTPGIVRVTLSAAIGSEPIEREFAMVQRRPTFGTWPPHTTGILDGDVGYLRLAGMDDDLVPHLREAMTSFGETEGLVVDVRGNGGGSRSLLIALAGYLIGPDEGPWVGNIAKYILSDSFDDSHLEARYMYKATDERWTDAQRRAIEAIAGFEPEWTPPGSFSEWHYLVLDRVGHEAEFFYDKPVVVLSDSWCFSATDIFLGALSGHARVTLMGEASAGGSARSQQFLLPNSRIRVQCASMASFRPDGRLYDGRGVEVDVPLQVQPAALQLDGPDSVLSAALARIQTGTH